jgi:predicted transcriptional regulator
VQALDRRTKYEIYSELLEVVMKRGSCPVTRASYGANLPVDRAKKFLRFLASRGFVKEEIVDDSTRYKITIRGLEYLEAFKKMRKLFAALSEELP